MRAGRRVLAGMNDNNSGMTTRDVSHLARFTIAAAVVAALIIVAFDNREDVRLGYVFGDTEAPVWIVLVVAGIAGVFIGWLIKHRPHRH